MKNLKKTAVLLLMVAFIAVAALSGCGGTAQEPAESTEAKPAESTLSAEEKEELKEEKNLVVLCGSDAAEFDAISDVNEKFKAANPDVTVDFSSLGGSNYENIMKVKMASNELPDIFSTHGWAKLRYAKYLLDLKDQPWVSRIHPVIMTLITDDDGRVLTLPIDSYKTGLTYNAGILESYGIEPPKTIEEFDKALEVIKTKSDGKVWGLHIGGGDSWMFGAFINTYSTPLTITAPSGNDGTALLDGTYDWNKLKSMPEKLVSYYKNGYLNKDCLTSKFADTINAFAEEKAVFAFMGPELATNALQKNPNLKVGVMPVFSIVPGDEPVFAGGERNSWGIWKDTESPTVAKKYLEFFAQSENVEAICKATLSPAGLVDVNPDLGVLNAYWEKYENNRVMPFWDRVYMPNGMWDVMSTAGQDLIGGALNPDTFTEHMKKEYLRLREVAKK